ncbi:BMP family lipoprotein [Paraclostridium tenue]|uniref:BMP family ABC transporter substrate-binding protein n=1 Tax=Paraclostridium tenue TaxID=1737 RepID=A0ABP3XCJ1_9FIRM|nr:BMP family ABC transporter substrate-binding protein [[Eubacterium] tenue]MBC8631372.1 BMP family ABC transporter substrate-binding protein [[Eubacterium] tenue]
MKFKKLLTLGLVTVLSGSMLVGCGASKGSSGDKENGNKKIKVTMITDVGGVNDQSFNQSAWEGLEKAKKDLGIEANYIESKQESDYATNVETAIDNGADLVIGVGFKLEKAIGDAAKAYPEEKFALIDADFGGKPPKNVESIMFNAQEASYLVGLVAGKLTESNKVGFVGGMESPLIESFEVGYEAGVKAVKPDAVVVAQYANNFADPAKGKSITNQMISNGVDIVFHAAGDTGNGVIEAAKEAGKKAIGVDRDQNSIAPETVITSAVKRVDVGVYNTVKNLVDGKFEGGSVVTYGLNENGVGVAETTKEDVAPDILEFVNQQGDKIKSGEIKVPATKAELEKTQK